MFDRNYSYVNDFADDLKIIRRHENHLDTRKETSAPCHRDMARSSKVARKFQFFFSSMRFKLPLPLIFAPPISRDTRSASLKTRSKFSPNTLRISGSV